MKRIHLAAILLISLYAFNTVNAANEALYTEWYQKGLEQIRQGNATEARKSFAVALSYDENRAEAKNGIALSDDLIQQQKTNPSIKTPAATSAATEIRLYGTYLNPSDSKNFEKAFGGGIQLRHWLTDSIGFAVSGGASQWEIKEHSETFTDEFTTTSMRMSGRQGVIPIGCSALLRSKLSDRASLTFEGGVRYLITKSNIKLFVNNGFYDETIDLDTTSALAGVLGAELNTQLTDHFGLFCGAGYQFDIVAGEIEFINEKISDVEYSALFLKTGLSVHF